MRRIALALVALISVGLVSCGGSSDSGSDATTTTAAAADTTTTEAAGEPVTQAVDKAVWFAGFKVTLGTGTFTPPSKVEIDATFENLGTETARFDGQLVLNAGGNGITSTDLTDIPEVPGGTTGKGSIRFDTGPSFEFEGASITIGSSEHQQAIVPLGTEGELVALEPVPVTVTGTATAGQLQIATHDGELRADIPETHGEVDKGQFALTIDFDVTNNGTGGGGYPFTADNLALTLPDGTTVAPDDAPIELLGHQATLKDQSVRFLVDDPAAGNYTLLLREGETEGTLKFTIPAASGGSGVTETTVAPTTTT